MSRYLIIIEETGTGYSAYSPDLPGCAATGAARDSVERQMHDAIEFHLDGLRRAIWKGTKPGARQTTPIINPSTSTKPGPRGSCRSRAPWLRNSSSLARDHALIR